MMKIILLAAAATGIAGGASAMPMSDLAAAANADLKQNVRIVCDRSGQCYQTRRQGQRQYREQQNYGYAPGGNYGLSYGYAPYGSQNGYGYGYGGGPSIGFSFGGGHRSW